MAIVLCCVPAGAGQPNHGNLQVFEGEITASYCAPNNPHREIMLKIKSMGHDKKTCTLKCIELGAKLVLYVPFRHAFYDLDNPEKVLPFAGQRVRVTGTLRKNEITVAAIEDVNQPFASAGSRSPARETHSSSTVIAAGQR
jgi:hypothetical protein